MQAGASYLLAGPLRWRDFDGEWVVYCTTTGSLRVSDPPTAAVLAVLEDGPATAAEVAQRIAAATQTDLTDAAATGIGSVLDDLQRTGFAECEAR